MNSFAHLSQILQEWPQKSIPQNPFTEYPHDRLRLLLIDLQSGNDEVEHSDIATLVRHTLRYEEEKYGSYPTLTLPSNIEPWPSRELWALSGCSVTTLENGMFGIRAKAWAASWAKPLLVQSPQGSDQAQVFSYADREEKRHPRCFENSDWRVPADPVLKSTFKGLTHYQSKSQAETIRAVMMSPPGAVRLVVLPTGSGKSLVGLSSAMLGEASNGGVSIVVVPTIALAYDQVVQSRAWNPGIAIDAWQSGLSEDEKKLIKERLRSGSQRILFAAPESVVGTLKSSLVDLAERGVLRSFIVDEAHLVSQWGASFRPEFQTMSALWRRMRDVSPIGKVFKTLLMTATLTKETYGDLCQFFDAGGDGTIRTLAGVHLRPEPDFFISKCLNEEEKISKVLEAIRHSPRPAILYVTKVQDAKDWYKRCLNEGWKRVGLVHGQSSSVDRERSVKLWRENKIDLMVATSAFGLGMDKSDVRLVLHACVPETIDRFYQEVGRGGRDGKASVSMMIYTQEDEDQAASMSKPTIIGDELGLARWRAMWQTKEQVDGLYYINLQARRHAIVYDGQRNEKWNMRTILLLVRAGAISLECPAEVPPPSQGETENIEVYQNRCREFWQSERLKIYFSLIGNNPESKEEWERAVGQYRKDFQRTSADNWKMMRDLLSGKTKTNVILQHLYNVPGANIHYVPARAENLEPTITGSVSFNLSPQLNRLLRGAIGGKMFVTYPVKNIKKQDLGRQWVESFKVLARHGICEYSMPSNWIERSKWYGRSNPIGEMHNSTDRRFVVVRDLEEDEHFQERNALPRVSFITPDTCDPGKKIEGLTDLVRPCHLIFLPEGCQDPNHPSRQLEDTYNNKISIHNLMNQLNL